MPWIENAAAADIPAKFHHEAGPNSMLIQIADPVFHSSSRPWFPTPKHSFKEIHQFEFFDVEEKKNPLAGSITDADAKKLVALLQHAKQNSMNVVVHCVAGLCRSGAVTEVGVMMGFEDVGRYRNPNLLVKHKMMKVLGWTYDEDEQPKPTRLSGYGYE